MFRRSGHCLCAFLGLRSTNSEWSDQSEGPGTALSGVNFFHWRSSRAIGSFARHSRPGVGPLACVNLSHRTDVTRPERKQNP
jgi:hypothetical protein